MRRSLVLATLLIPSVAFAQEITSASVRPSDRASLGTQASIETNDGRFATAYIGLLDRAGDDFGKIRVEDGRLVGGGKDQRSVFREGIEFGRKDANGDTAWKCTADARVLTFDTEAKVDIGAPKWKTDGNSNETEYDNPEAPSKAGQRYAKARKATSLFGDCNLSAEASLAQINGECQTAVGKFTAKADGPMAKAGCGCDGCEFGAALWWVEGTYETPEISVCGVGGKASGTLGGGEGIKLGAKVGASKFKISAGPVSFGAGFALSNFDAKAARGCLDAILGVPARIKGAWNDFTTGLSRLGALLRNPYVVSGQGMGGVGSRTLQQ